MRRRGNEGMKDDKEGTQGDEGRKRGETKG